jgi:hypothetical protein
VLQHCLLSRFWDQGVGLELPYKTAIAEIAASYLVGDLLPSAGTIFLTNSLLRAA